MGRIVDPKLFERIHDYFKIYLPTQKGCSEHTIRSYRTAVDAFHDIVKEQKRISLSAVTVDMQDSKMLAKFLDSIEERGCAISTRNNRFYAIRSFFEYAAKIDPAEAVHKTEASKIPVKNLEEENIVEYLSEAAVKALLEQPDPLTKNGMRDRFLMLMMYDTAARVQGVLDIKLCDIKLGKSPTVIIHLKGGRDHPVPLMKQTVEHYKNYLKVFHKGESAYSERYLFYTSNNDAKKSMESSTARKLIIKYAAEARLRCPEILEHVHPHTLRHSRAMHLYQHGMDLTLVMST